MTVPPGNGMIKSANVVKQGHRGRGAVDGVSGVDGVDGVNVVNVVKVDRHRRFRSTLNDCGGSTVPGGLVIPA